MFYDVFNKLCEKKKISANKACIEMEISRTSAVKWRQGAVPSGSTLNKIAKYFEVSIDYLLENEEKKETPSTQEDAERLTQLDEINEILESFPSNLLKIAMEQLKSLDSLKANQENSEK